MNTTVLIADDHTLVAEGLRYVIDAEPDLKVVGHAQNGQEALRKALEMSPDIVLMDNAMPILNGIEATRLIRKRCPGTQIIMLSMYCDQSHVLRALQAGARGYLLKKSVAQELVTAIRRVHAGQHYLTSDLAEGVISRVSKAPEDPLERLSSRERQVLQMVAEGHTAIEIGGKLSLSPKTVETYRSRMMDKLDLHDLAGLIKFAIQQGVISIDE
jgi:DNA-binding NarL/FixJ family response regulator